KLSGPPRRKVWAIALLSAPLLTMSQPPLAVPWIGFLALAPLFVALPRLSAGGAWLASFLVGMLYFGVNMWWLGQMTTDPGSEIYIFLMFAFVTVIMAAFYGVAGMTIRWLLTRRKRWLIWFVPLAWVGFEFAHEFDIPAPYPWLPVAYAITHLTPFIQTADLWGAYGVSMTVILVNLSFAAPVVLEGRDARLALRREGIHRFAVPVAAAFVVMAGCVYGWVRMAHFDRAERDDGPLIACVQGNLAQEIKVRHDPARIPAAFGEHLDLTEQATSRGAELICWSETILPGGCTREGLRWQDPADSARYFPDGVPDPVLLTNGWNDDKGRTRYASYVERLRALIAHKYQTPMLVGAGTPVPESEQFHDWKDYSQRRYNTAILFDAQGRTVASYDKRYIVPGGEYVPHEGNPLIRAIVEKYAKELQGYASYVEPGVRRTLFRMASKTERLGGRDWAFTSSICYEYAWPGCYSELHRDAEPYPDFQINLSNEGWFKQSAELDQALDFCRFRCIESRVPMVRATNTGISCTIDACGRVREVLTVDGRDREVQGVFLTRPPVLEHPRPTLFVSTIGRSLGFLSLGTIVPIMALMAMGRIREFRRHRKEIDVMQKRAPDGRGIPSQPAPTATRKPRRHRTKARASSPGSTR
ncbi:MAG: apolipoprotein N-acyltransferase, partial [Planctomycetes bacterium]|nr:apolipoprotein N-acyltransferase [Planctomycetota bacterium]